MQTAVCWKAQIFLLGWNNKNTHTCTLRVMGCCSGNQCSQRKLFVPPLLNLCLLDNKL